MLDHGTRLALLQRQNHGAMLRHRSGLAWRNWMTGLMAKMARRAWSERLAFLVRLALMAGLYVILLLLLQLFWITDRHLRVDCFMLLLQLLVMLHLLILLLLLHFLHMFRMRDGQMLLMD